MKSKYAKEHKEKFVMMIISIHLPSCREKYIKEHGKEPPAKPSEEIIHKLINQGMSSAQAYNEAAFFSAQGMNQSFHCLTFI